MVANFAAELRVHPLRTQMMDFALLKKRWTYSCRFFGLTARSHVPLNVGQRRHHVDALVRALRRKDRGHQELPSRFVMQLAGDVGVHHVQKREDLVEPRLALGGGLGLSGQDDLT